MGSEKEAGGFGLLAPIPHTAWFHIGRHLWATDGAVLVRQDCPHHPDPQPGGTDAPYHYAAPDDWRPAAALLANCAEAATTAQPAAGSGLGFDARFGPLLYWASSTPGIDSVLCRVNGAGAGDFSLRVVISGSSGILAVVAPQKDIAAPGVVHWSGVRHRVKWGEVK